MESKMWGIPGSKTSEAPKPEAPRSKLERYSGVCDVYSPEEARAMADELRRNRKNRHRKIMIGVMTHPIVLDPDLPVPKEVREDVSKEFPSVEKMAGGFIDDPDVLNTIHIADLYGPEGPWKAQEAPNVLRNLELCVEHGGEYLHAIQLDITWPKPDEIKKFKEKNPNIILILQVGKFAIKDVDGDPQKIVDKLREYGDSIDHVLLDMSMGKGAGMEAGGLLSLLRAITRELPDLGLAVAGGLGPEDSPEFNLIAEEFPGISHDAQGNVKSADAPRDKFGHLISTTPADPGRSTEYIRRKCKVLDNYQEE